MTLIILLYIYLGLVSAFLIYNIFIVSLTYKFRFVGPLVYIFVPLYLVGIFLILLFSYGSIQAIDWQQTISLSTFKFW